MNTFIAMIVSTYFVQKIKFSDLLIKKREGVNVSQTLGRFLS